jgi:hypothetical protein
MACYLFFLILILILILVPGCANKDNDLDKFIYI